MSWCEVRDEATGDLILGRVRRCSSFLCRLRGLTFRRRLGENRGLLLVGGRESRAGAAIHMMFVFFPIGVVWLDAENRVVDTCLARPFQMLRAPKEPAQDVLEGPPGLLQRVRLGQVLRLRKVAHD